MYIKHSIIQALTFTVGAFIMHKKKSASDVKLSEQVYATDVKQRSKRKETMTREKLKKL